MKIWRFVALIAVAASFASACTPGSGEGEKVVAYFKDVGDLVPAATVQIADVEIGSVTDIELVLQDGEMLAKITMAVPESQKVPAEGVTALVRQTSLLGEQFVELQPQTTGAPYLGDEPVVIPVERTDKRVDIETVLEDVSGFIGGGGLEDLNRFTHAQALILEKRGDRFGAVIEELEKFTRVLAARRLDVGAAIDSLADASKTLASNRQTIDDFLDSLEEANALLADEGDRFGALFTALQRFGAVNARFLARHERNIDRNFRALRPIFRAIASADDELRIDITQLKTFLQLFPKSHGGGPGDRGRGDYIQAEAVVCEVLANCHTNGEIGDVPGQGRDRR
jgi:phospholipid/cholesterol/gamma-HCH transport system substrate-binding protein